MLIRLNRRLLAAGLLTTAGSPALASVPVEIGAAVIGMALAEYIHGDQFAEADRFLDTALCETAYETADDLLQRITPRLWELFPDLFGFEGEHPAWALRAGLVR